MLRSLFVCVFFLLIAPVNAASVVEVGELSLPTGLHQESPYNSKLTSVVFSDTRSNGIPFVGCGPLAFARTVFYNQSRNPLAELSAFENLLSLYHQTLHPYLTYKSNETFLSASGPQVENGIAYQFENLYTMPSINSMPNERLRISDLYIYVRDKIKQNKPVIVNSNTGKHLFVIDGYKTVNPTFGSEDLYLHVLWGWKSKDGEWVQIDQGAGLERFFWSTDPTVNEFFADFSLGAASFFTLRANTITSWATGAYGNNQDISKVLSIPRASSMTVTVAGLTESKYDYLYIYDANNNQLQKLDGAINQSFAASGSSITARLTTDGSVTKSGVTVTINSTASTSNSSIAYIDKCIAKFSSYFGSRSGGVYSCYESYYCQNTTGTASSPVIAIGVEKNLSGNVFYYYWDGWNNLDLSYCN